MNMDTITCKYVQIVLNEIVKFIRVKDIMNKLAKNIPLKSIFILEGKMCIYNAFYYNFLNVDLSSFFLVCFDITT